MEIRNVKIDDAEKLLNLMNRLDYETKYMLYEPGERKGTVDGLAKKLTDTINNNDLFLVMDDGKELRGFISADRGVQNRIKHTAYIVIGIESKYTGLGYGTKLFEKLNVWALQNKITRLELTVMCENKAGINLYKKMGFEIEGTRKNSCIVDGKYMDEFYMGKIII